MDNQATGSETGALDLNGAAAAFGELLSPEPVEVQPEEPKAEEVEEVKAEAEPEATEAVEEDDPVVTIKVDGQDVQVKLSELKNGYQRQADYTRKTMQVAEERKAAEAERSKALQERQAYAANLQRMQAQLEGTLQEQQKTVDWEKLLAEDPVEFLKQKHLAETRQAQLNQVYTEQQRIAAQSKAEAEEAHSRFLSQQREELLAKLPEWKDAKKAEAERVAIRDYLLEQGYDSKTIDSIASARDVITARKAMLYDQMVSKAQAAAKKVATLPKKVEAPGNGTQVGLDRRTAAYQKLSKSGRVEDAAAVFAGIL